MHVQDRAVSAFLKGRKQLLLFLRGNCRKCVTRLETGTVRAVFRILAGSLPLSIFRPSKSGLSVAAPVSLSLAYCLQS